MLPKELYELSLTADQDLEEIFDHTLQEFGLDQAVAYLSAFDPLFTSLMENPELGRTREEIKPGLRSIMKGSHVVFCRILPGKIRIVRVLHGSRDLPRFL